MDHLEQYTGKRAILKMTWPVFIELTLQMLVGNMDQFMVSRYYPESVGAIGNANQILELLLLTFSVVSMATAILVSQYLGGGNLRKVGETYTVAVLLNLLFSFLVTAALVGLNRPVFELMRVPAELMEESSAYITVIGSCISFQAIFLTFSAIFRSNAWMKESMYLSVVINVVNIAGNALLIPRLGVVGAAVSSNISRFLGMILIIILFQRKTTVRMSFSYLRPFPRKQLFGLLGIGLPSGSESLSYSMSQIVIMSCINGLGMAAISTKVFASMFAMLSYLYASAIGQAQQIVVGYFIGARRTEDAYRQVLKTLRSAVLVTLGISTLLFLASSFIFRFLTANEEVIRLGQIIMGIEILLEVGRAVNIVLVRALQGTGDIKFPTTIGILSQWLVAAAGAFLFGVVFRMGLPGIWLAMTLDECLRAVLFLLRWKSGRWKAKRLVDGEPKSA